MWHVVEIFFCTCVSSVVTETGEIVFVTKRFIFALVHVSCSNLLTVSYLVADRYRLLPSARHQLQFVQLQLELLDDYRVRLLQIRGELQSPLSADYCSILNTVSYIIEILQQWTNQPVSSVPEVILHAVLLTLEYQTSVFYQSIWRQSLLLECRV